MEAGIQTALCLHQDIKYVIRYMPASEVLSSNFINFCQKLNFKIKLESFTSVSRHLKEQSEGDWKILKKQQFEM